jgi:DNA (cytosine-5)-methyltransferase 1
MIEGKRPRLLDLFCGAGGAAKGYSDAGFEVVGVDIAPQPNYPFEFICGDALGELAGGLAHNIRFDAIHASPPCQRFSLITATSGRPNEHPDLIGPIRGLLAATGLPYVIENVPRAPLRGPILLCGVAMGLRLDGFVLRRHRLFECSFPAMSPGCGCHRGDGVTLGVYGGGTSTQERNPNTSGGRPAKANREQARAIMGMPWANRTEICQAIPPAYSEHVGRFLAAAVRESERLAA